MKNKSSIIALLLLLFSCSFTPFAAKAQDGLGFKVSAGFNRSNFTKAELLSDHQPDIGAFFNFYGHIPIKSISQNLKVRTGLGAEMRRVEFQSAYNFRMNSFFLTLPLGLAYQLTDWAIISAQYQLGYRLGWSVRSVGPNAQLLEAVFPQWDRGLRFTFEYQSKSPYGLVFNAFMNTHPLIKDYRTVDTYGQLGPPQDLLGFVVLSLGFTYTLSNE